MATDNPMRAIVMEKLVVNIGTGSEENVQNNAKRLLEIITGRKPSNAHSKKRNPAFKISKGQKIGAFVTVRGQDIKPLANRLLDAVDKKLKESTVTDNSLSFGIHEYIDISGVKYDPKIGMMGMNINLSFKRKGLRVAQRKRKRAEIPAFHRKIVRDDIKDFMKKEFNVEFVSA